MSAWGRMHLPGPHRGTWGPQGRAAKWEPVPSARKEGALSEGT